MSEWQPIEKVEITPEMIRAGVAVVSRLRDEVGSHYLVEAVYEAMESARRMAP